MINPKKYYLFDIGGILITTFYGREDAMKKLKISVGTFSAAVNRGSCLSRKYYISKNKNFNINSIKTRYSHNPIIGKQLCYFGAGLSNIFENQDDFYYED